MALTTERMESKNRWNYRTFNSPDTVWEEILMKFDIIKKEIDKWDPINLLDHAPSDEYDIESMEILFEFQQDIEQNGIIIYDVFSKAFGETFTRSVNECVGIAQNIMSSMNSTAGDGSVC